MFKKITPEIKVYVTLKIHIFALLQFVSYLPKHPSLSSPSFYYLTSLVCILTY